MKISNDKIPTNTPVDTGRKLNARSEGVLDVFLMSYVRSIYVLCLWGRQVYSTLKRHGNDRFHNV